jgi:tRNA A58 N-methylase Trm61
MEIDQDNEVAEEEEEEQVHEIFLDVPENVEAVLPVNIVPGTGVFFCLLFSAFCISVADLNQ